MIREGSQPWAAPGKTAEWEDLATLICFVVLGGAKAQGQEERGPQVTAEKEQASGPGPSRHVQAGAPRRGCHWLPSPDIHGMLGAAVMASSLGNADHSPDAHLIESERFLPAPGDPPSEDALTRSPEVFTCKPIQCPVTGTKQEGCSLPGCGFLHKLLNLPNVAFLSGRSRGWVPASVALPLPQPASLLFSDSAFRPATPFSSRTETPVLIAGRSRQMWPWASK